MASRNHHQPECHPLKSFSANHPPGSAYNFYLQHVACCYTLQLHIFRLRLSSTSACKCDSQARRTQHSQICRTYREREPPAALSAHWSWYVLQACSRQAVLRSGCPHPQPSSSKRLYIHRLLPQPLRLPSSRRAASSMSISIVSR